MPNKCGSVHGILRFGLFLVLAHSTGSEIKSCNDEASQQQEEYQSNEFPQAAVLERTSTAAQLERIYFGTNRPSCAEQR